MDFRVRVLSRRNPAASRNALAGALMMIDVINAPKDPDSGVFLIGKEIEYRDSGESEVARIIRSATDRSSHSDELRLAAHDWPTLYHLSSARSNLLRMLHWQPSQAVLEVGAGCGALTRYLGETGASVDAIEGNLERARIAAERCSGLSRVRIAAGRLEDITAPAGYDVATVIGVLEYSSRYGSTPSQFLARVAALLNDRGILILAIENQLGLKYLMGCVEDHLGRPFAGIEGYEPDDGIRTFSRAVLEHLLKQAGFAETDWFYPFPDYKLPTTVIRHAIASDPAYADHCSWLIRTPVLDHVSSPLVAFDARRALRVWAEAGLLPDVSNSFLVIAAKRRGSVQEFISPDVAVWQFTDPSRLSIWAAVRLLGRRRSDREGGAATSGRNKRRQSLLEEVRSLSISPLGAAQRRRGWLKQIEPPPRPFLDGKNLLDLARGACLRRDEKELKRTLHRWRQFLDNRTLDQAKASEGTQRNPFADFTGSPGSCLSGNLLDVNLDNFIDDGSAIHNIDCEWSTEGPVSRNAVGLRALWYLSGQLVEWGTHPWDSALSRFELAARLCGLAELPFLERWIDKLLLAESELQALITGRPAQVIADELHAQRGYSAEAVARFRTRRSDQLEQDVQRMQAWAESAVKDVEIRDKEIFRLQDVIQRLVATKDAEITSLRSRISALNKEKQRLEKELNRLKSPGPDAPESGDD